MAGGFGNAFLEWHFLFWSMWEERNRFLTAQLKALYPHGPTFVIYYLGTHD